MLIKIKKESLFTTVKHIASIVKGNSTIPIIDNLLLAADDTGLTIASTNLETFVQKTIECEVVKTGTTTINAKLFKNIISNISDDDVVILQGDDSVLKIKTDKSEYNFEAMSSSDFPVAPETEEAEPYYIDAQDFKDAVSKVLPFTANDELRPALNGVYFDSTEGLTLVCTDAHRLSWYKLDEHAAFNGSFVMNKGTLSFLNGIISDSKESQLQMSVGLKNAVFVIDGYTVYGRLVDTKYPNYRAVIPEPRVHIEIDKTPLVEALKRIIFAVPNTTLRSNVKFSNSEALLHTSDLDYCRDGKEYIACKSSDDIEVAFNTKFLQECIAILDDEIKIGIKEKNKGVLFSSNDKHSILLMPVL